MIKKNQFVINILTFVVDFLLLVIAGLSSYFIRFSEEVKSIRETLFIPDFYNYLYLLLTTALVTTALLSIMDLYRFKRKRIIGQFKIIVIGVSSAMTIVVFLIFFQKDSFSSRFIIISTWGLSIVYLTLIRFIWKYIESILARRGIGGTNTIIVADSDDNHIVDAIENDRYHTLAGFVSSQSKNITKSLDQIIKNSSYNIDTIILSDAKASSESMIDLIQYASDHHIDFQYEPKIIEASVRLKAVELQGIPLMKISQTPLDGWGKIIKRMADIVISSIAIIMTSPIMLVIAIAIKIKTGGSVLFKCHRVGQHEKTFVYYKFKSMNHQDSWNTETHHLRYDPEFRKAHGDSLDSPIVKLKNDPRITPLGAFMRRFSLDEFPEFFLVFQGKMSMVGPRPHEAEEVNQYHKAYKRIFSVKPGMSGLAQMTSRDLSFDEEMRIDLLYVENWSMWTDIAIILKTPFRLFAKRNKL